VAAAPVTFVVTISGAQVVPPSDAAVTGFAHLTLDTETERLEYAITLFSGAASKIGGYSLREGALGTTGLLLYQLGGAGTLQTAGMVQLTQAQVEKLRLGLIYIEVTSETGAPVARGQVLSPAIPAAVPTPLLPALAQAAPTLPASQVLSASSGASGQFNIRPPNTGEAGLRR
jgi:hypothetical protein